MTMNMSIIFEKFEQKFFIFVKFEEISVIFEKLKCMSNTLVKFGQMSITFEKLEQIITIGKFE